MNDDPGGWIKLEQAQEALERENEFLEQEHRMLEEGGADYKGNELWEQIMRQRR